MNGITVLVALAAVGVDYGWQPGVDGQLEYIVQIEPALLDALKSGKDITSDIHPDARGVRRFRIHVGTGPLPRNGVLAANTTPTRLSTSDADPQMPAGTGFPIVPGAGYGQGSASGAAALSDEPAYTTPASSGILNLPPPPALIGPDGKASVLVRPGDRALPGIAAPANSSLPTYDSTPPEASPVGTLSVPAAPPAGSGGWQFPESPARPRPTICPVLSARQIRAGLFPVPAAGPETGLPEPIRGAGMKPGNQSAFENTASNELNTQQTTTDLLNQLAENHREAAAQKPTIDKEEAERLIAERAKELQAEHPWAPLVLTSLALFGSLAANLYLGWIASGIYRRYRDMCDELHEFVAALRPLRNRSRAFGGECVTADIHKDRRFRGRGPHRLSSLRRRVCGPKPH